MNARSRILAGRYVDSVVLMQLAQNLAAEKGVEDAAAMMATAANTALLRQGGFVDGDLDAGPNDLVVAVRAASESAAAAALARVEELLAARRADDLTAAATLDEALARRPDSNVAVISLPGEYAAPEARRALERGLHVFVFSSNVAVEDELQLKRLARSRGLLCMGPDCGTAIVAGKGLGFANAVRRGPVGIVGASGTGIQVVSSLLDAYGVGVSHAIGCGSRDLSEAVGGVTARAGIEALLADEATEAIVLVSKPPAPRIAAELRRLAASAPKPIEIGFVGDSASAATLDELARRAAAAVGRPVLDIPLAEEKLVALRRTLRPAQRYLRGLYAGGTLAYEAQLVLLAQGIVASSNAPLPGSPGLADATRSEGNTVVDLGAEEFTRGLPHPMIDARTRTAQLLREAEDPEVAVVLLDVVLGFGAAADPAADLADAIAAARARNIVVLAYVCGTKGDPQGFDAQEQTLRSAGAVVLPTNAAAARAAARIVSRAHPAIAVGGTP